MIEQAFTLRTDRFGVPTQGGSLVNPRCLGRDFALWLRGRLQQHGLSSSEPIQEDWGWALVVPYQGRRFTLSIGVMDDSIGRTPLEWRIGIAYEIPLNAFRAWFRAPPTSELSELARLLEDTLRSDTQMSELAPA